MDLSKFLHGLFQIDTWIFKDVTWIWIGCYMDLLNKHGFVKVVLFFLPFAKQNQTEVWPRLLLKLLLWTKGQSTQCLGSIVPLAMFFKWFFLLNICLDNQNGKASRMRTSSKRGRSYPNSAKQDSRGAVGYQRSERRYLDK